MSPLAFCTGPCFPPTTQSPITCCDPPVPPQPGAKKRASPPSQRTSTRATTSISARVHVPLRLLCTSAACGTTTTTLYSVLSIRHAATHNPGTLRVPPQLPFPTVSDASLHAGVHPVYAALAALGATFWMLSAMLCALAERKPRRVALAAVANIALVVAAATLSDTVLHYVAAATTFAAGVAWMLDVSITPAHPHRVRSVAVLRGLVGLAGVGAILAAVALFKNAWMFVALAEYTALAAFSAFKLVYGVHVGDTVVEIALLPGSNAPVLTKPVKEAKNLR